jgi:hypothetical protein
MVSAASGIFCAHSGSVYFMINVLIVWLNGRDMCTNPFCLNGPLSVVLPPFWSGGLNELYYCWGGGNHGSYYTLELIVNPPNGWPCGLGMLGIRTTRVKCVTVAKNRQGDMIVAEGFRKSQWNQGLELASINEMKYFGLLLILCTVNY